MTVQTLDLKNSLQLRLTQKMQQAIKLLQMSNQELSLFVADYIESNPLLETELYDDSPGHDLDQDDGLNENYSDDFSEKFSDTNDFDSQSFENVWQDDHIPVVSYGADDYDPLSNLSEENCFKDYVRSQIDMVIAQKDKDIAYALCDLLMDEGYLPPSWQTDMEQLGYHDKDHINSILTTLQTLEPTGIFARSLEECLLIQLKDLGHYSEEIEAFLIGLKSHGGSPKDLAKKLHISLEKCLKYLDILKTLHPKPGLSIEKNRTHQIIPDVIMRWKNPHEWSVELNSVNLPKVYVNSAYYLELKSSMKSTNDTIFLQEKFTEAKWLLKSLHQRALNIMKVTNYIVRKQAEFFRSTTGRIKPLTLKEVALETELSESTVSRVTTDKYIETPRGLFELKYFFSSNVNAADNDNLQSAKSIQVAIRKIIDCENHDAPLSDNDILERLKLMGISVARRTIAKYRDIMRIENASDRLKYYKWGQKDGKILAIKS